MSFSLKTFNALVKGKFARVKPILPGNPEGLRSLKGSKCYGYEYVNISRDMIPLMREHLLELEDGVNVVESSDDEEEERG